MAPAGASTLSILARMVVTAPVISSTVSPRSRRPIKSPPICEGVASPDIIRSNAVAASSRESVAPVATLPMRVLNSSMTQLSVWFRRPPAARGVPGVGKVEKIFQDDVAVLRCDAFRVKLHAVNRQRLVRGPHQQSAVRLRRDVQALRQG